MNSSTLYTATELSLAENLSRYSDSCWDFLTECIYTIDEADVGAPVKAFPDWGYLHALVDLWLNEQIVVVWKPRRMVVTWTLCACQLWLAMLRPHVNCYIGARKADMSDELIDKVKQMYEYIPKGKLPTLPAATKTYNLFDLPGIDSQVVGIAEGADQLRQVTATSVMFDEFGFWEKAKESWQASLPTLIGGGRICIISTTAAGFFEDLVKGRLAEEDRLWELTQAITPTYQDSEFTAMQMA